MNSNKNDSFRVGHFETELDQTEVISNLIDAKGKQKEKYLLFLLQKNLSGHDVEILRILKDDQSEFSKNVLLFFSNILEEYRKSYRKTKLLSFVSAKKIEEEATILAMKTTMKILKEISMLKDPSIKALMENHREILSNVGDTFIEMIKDTDNTPGINSIDDLGDLLKG